VALLRENQQAGYSYLYDHYAPTLYGVIVRIIPNQEAANDVLQETFIKIWKNREKYQPNKGRLYTWMLNIARNTSIDYLRLAENQREIQDIDSNVYAVDKQHYTKQATDETGILELIEKLSPDRKQLLDMAYFQGYTHEEIAKKLEMPLGTVKTKIRSAILELRKYFTSLVIYILLQILP
jgi:RNA polymerase sigma factor (sigma-70 family)